MDALALQGRDEEARKAYSTAMELGASCDNVTLEFLKRLERKEETINYPVELAEKRSYSIERRKIYLLIVYFSG